MKKRKTLSVVIGAYNEEKYISKTLTSLINQKVAPDEIIVVDNNSTDKTASIARSFGVKVLKEKKQGYVHAVQKGLISAKGDIIAITDADTILPSNWTAEFVKAFDDPQVVGVGTALDSWDSPVYSFFNRYFYNNILYVHFLFGRPVLAGNSMAVRRDILRKCNGYDPAYQIGADTELGERIRKYGKVPFLYHVKVKTSSRRFQNDLLPSLFKYAKAYIFSVWVKRPVKDPLSIIR